MAWTTDSSDFGRSHLEFNCFFCKPFLNPSLCAERGPWREILQLENSLQESTLGPIPSEGCPILQSRALVRFSKDYEACDGRMWEAGILLGVCVLYLFLTTNRLSLLAVGHGLRYRAFESNSGNYPNDL